MSTKRRVHRNYDAMALAVASGLSIRAAAEQAHVAESTGYAWSRDSDFQGRVAELRSEFVATAASRLACGMTQATTKLIELIDSLDDKTALQAAVRVIELGIKLRDSEDLARRLAELEQRIQQQCQQQQLPPRSHFQREHAGAN